MVHSLSGRSLTQNPNDMLHLASIPSAIFPPEPKTFQSSDEYCVNLRWGHLVQLKSSKTTESNQRLTEETNMLLATFSVG